MPRWIMHMDMDAFFASVEQMDNPELVGKPVIVGGAVRGVVSASSYEARRFGVRSAMPMFKARELCPQGVFLPVRMRRYIEISRQIITVLKEFSPLVEQASVDEAFIDLSAVAGCCATIEEVAQAIKQAVRGVSGLSCSVGLSHLKFLSKIASDLRKPDGLSVIYPQEAAAFLQSMPVEKIPGVGKQTLKVLQSFGVNTAGDFAAYPASFWERRLGKFGQMLHERASGIDEREVVPYRPPKSESAERTLPHNTANREEMRACLAAQAERVAASLRKNGFAGRTITLKVKYADFTLLTRSRTLEGRTADQKVIYDTAVDLLEVLNPERPIRLIGVGVSHFEGTERTVQLPLDHYCQALLERLKS